MPTSPRWKTVTIEGAPLTDVTIQVRDRGDEPPPPAFEGATNSQGRLKLILEADYFVILPGGVPLDLTEGPDSTSIRLTGG